MRYWMAPAGLHIEPGALDDARALARIHAESFCARLASRDFINYIAEPSASSVFIACDAGRRIAGFAVFRLTGEDAELLSLAVTANGVARALARALLQAAATRTCVTRAVAHMFLEVEDGNVPALALYRRLGFVEIGRRKAYYPKPDGSAATALVMRADIA